MDSSGLDFQGIFGLLRAGSAPSLSSEDLASRISSCVGQTADSRAQPRARPSVTDTDTDTDTVTVTDTDTDVTCLSLTLTEAIISRLTAHSLTRDAAIYYDDVIRRLFGQMNLMAKLVSLLSGQGQLLSHLSAKCMSVYVVSDVCSSGGVSGIWTHTCAEAFEKPASSGELDSCLWSLTAAIKAVLRGNTRQDKSDVLKQLLSGLDCSITELYSNLVPQDNRGLGNLSKSMCEFFDLLEVLSAARLRYGVCSSIQRVMFVQSRALLHVMRADVEYFVKKRALLLLKRRLLRRCGEDWALGEVRSALREDPRLTEDMRVMADGVLQEVNAGWLKEVPVKAQASFFGGNSDASLSGTQKDDVILRAVSLILLKSLEINIQSPRPKGAESDADICQYLTALRSFLQHHGTLTSPEAHGCCWVSAVFAEQDDDMMESSNTLIGLYLHQKSLSGSDSGLCVWGFNPHCHFILLLRSLSFDHTVLLDFLISSETCFLEYCIRYLKLLRRDRTGLSRSCRHIEDRDGRLGRADPTVPCTTSSTGNDVKAALVDYGSSDESEEAEEASGGTETEASVMALECASGSLLGKVFACLMDLRTVVTRLHNRGLFPYNPTSLLKLLNCLEPG